ncbi:hypothetical protein niasHT_019799 [Heterodera trifolii]|uniref:Uncharacterized protein n=1 Tax=Heterodera trifolii TaxID=157864 RepID=A0ABD2LDQ6_9BILA
MGHQFIPATSSMALFARNREIIGSSNLSAKFDIIDRRIASLEQSWRNAIPISSNSATAGTSAMSFDYAENRFLLCGNARGNVSVVDFESFSNSLSNAEVHPRHYVVINTNRKSHHEFMVNGCQWYPVDSSIFATSGRDKLLKIWDADQLKSVEKFAFEQPISSFHWFVPCDCNSSLISIATSSSNVVLLDPRLGNTAQQIRCLQQRIWSVRWDRFRDYVLVTGSDSGEIALWDIRSGKNELKRVKNPYENGKSKSESDRKRTANRMRNSAKLAHSDRIVCLRCTSDGRFLLSLSQNRNICVWDAETMRMLCHIKVPESEGDLSTFPVQFELCDEGRFIWLFIPNSNNVTVVGIADPKLFSNRPIVGNIHFQTLRGHFQNVLSCAYRKEYNQLITSSTDRLILVWAPKMDEFRSDSAIQQRKQQLHEDAFSDDEDR